VRTLDALAALGAYADTAVVRNLAFQARHLTPSCIDRRHRDAPPNNVDLFPRADVAPGLVEPAPAVARAQLGTRLGRELSEERRVLGVDPEVITWPFAQTGSGQAVDPTGLLRG